MSDIKHSPASTLTTISVISPMMLSIRQKITTINGVIITLLASVMVLCVVWQVVSRYILGTPSTVTDEIARFLFMWVGMLGAVQAAAYKQHLAIDLLPLQLSGSKKIALTIFVECCILGFAVIVMCWGGIQITHKTFASQQITPSLQIPMGYIYTIIPIAGVMIAYLSLTNIYMALAHPVDTHTEEDHGMV